MFEYFPKINYGFSGGTFEVTDIFKSINLVFDKPDAVLTTNLLSGERPDQISNRLYKKPDYLWSLFLVNGIRNPFREWAQSQDSYTKQIESEYDGWVYQFANTSIFLPDEGSSGFTGDALNPYDGVDLSDLLPGDLIIYETGSGPFSVKSYGAGGITSTNSCGSPHFGQSLIPDNFDKQETVTQIAAGDYFNACLDSQGYIYVWGGLDLSSNTNWNKFNTLYKSKIGNYKSIEASGPRLIAINSNNTLECFGTCTDFTAYSADTTTNVKKTAWTSNVSGGVAILTNGTSIGYGLTFSNALYDVDCGSGYCVGIVASSYGLTAFGTDAGNGNLVPPNITGITLISVTSTHALALATNGQVYGWGNNTDGQTDVPTKTFTKISAGKRHSAAIDSNNNLNIWGKILYYGDAGCAGQTEETITPVGLSGAFSAISSGYEHVLLKGTGTNKKYIGVIDAVDTAYKRVFVKTYQFPDSTPVLLSDPSGTVVSIWRYNTDTQKYEQLKTIQHKLLSIIKYLDHTKYINQNGLLLNPDSIGVWKDTYLPNYQNTENNDTFITPRKELMDIDLYNKSKIKQLSLTGVKNLQKAIQDLFKTNNTNNIKISDL